MLRHRLSCFVYVVTLVIWGALASVDAVRAETRVALVVANAGYAKAPLGNPLIDSELIGDALVSMGFNVTVVKDADLETFARALQSFYAKREVKK